jgi:hypothetical protein
MKFIVIFYSLWTSINTLHLYGYSVNEPRPNGPRALQIMQPE